MIPVPAGAAKNINAAVAALAREHRDTVMIGRTHGVHAEPTTFGAKAALWALQIERDRKRLIAARDTVAVMKLSGAVGTYSNIPPEVEAHVGAARVEHRRVTNVGADDVVDADDVGAREDHGPIVSPHLIVKPPDPSASRGWRAGARSRAP